MKIKKNPVAVYVNVELRGLIFLDREDAKTLEDHIEEHGFLNLEDAPSSLDFQEIAELDGEISSAEVQGSEI